MVHNDVFTELCIQMYSGELERSISVYVTTSDITALGNDQQSEVLYDMAYFTIQLLVIV